MLITENSANKIRGVLSCYDRVVIQGSLPGWNYADGMTTFLKAHGIRIFDYAEFAKNLRDEVRENTEKIAKENDIEITFIAKSSERKEDIVKKIIEERGNHPGLVCILSAMESCQAYRPWHDKKSHTTYLRYTDGRCLHYYFYFIDENLGLCYLRVPTWCPFRLQFYFNGHNWLACQLDKQGIEYHQEDNAFLDIADFEKAQQIADSFQVEVLHRILDSYAKQFCPITEKFEKEYHWTIMQAEYATDIVFNSQKDLQEIYENLIYIAIHSVKPEDIATFLGRKLHGNYQDEMGNKLNVRIEGMRIKHSMGPVSIKMYDKFKLVLRIETTVNNPTFFKHYREVVKRDGTCIRKYAHMRKSIYSLFDLQKLLRASNHRYLEFISSFEDKSTGIKALNKVTQRSIEKDRSYKGINFFNSEDLKLLQAIVRGEYNISGFQNKNVKEQIPNKSSGQISRALKRLRVHGLIKKIRNTYKYYLTTLGRKVIATGLKLRELFIIPQLSVSSTTK